MKDFRKTKFASLFAFSRWRLFARWAVLLFATWIFADAGTLSAQEALLFDTSSATSTEDRLLTIDQIGGSPTTLQNSSGFTSTPGKMAVDRVNRRIYVLDQLTGGGGMFRFNSDGTGKTTIFTNSVAGSQCLGIAVDSTHGIVYFITSNASSSEDKLLKCGLDGSGLTLLTSGSSLTAFPGACAVDEINQKIYVCDIQSGGGGVFRFNSDGSNKTTIYANSASGSQTFGVAVDSSRGIVYIVTSNASSAEDKLIKTDLNGGTPTVLVSGASLTTFPNQVAVDISGNRIYVTDSQTAGGGVFRFDSAGASKTRVYTNSTSGSSMIGIALSSAAATTISALDRANGNPSNSSTVNWTGTFAHAVYNLTAANFSLSGTAISGAVVGTPATSDAGFNWNIPVTVANSGSLQLRLANSTSMSASISSLPFSGQSYTMNLDSTGPTITIGSPSSSSAAGGPVTYTVTYADPAFNASTLASGNITVNTTGSASPSSVSVTGSGTTRTVTLAGITGNGTLGISIGAGTASDTFGNLALAAGSSATFSVDNLAPTIAIGSPSTATTRAGPVSFTVTYADANLSSVILQSSDVTVNSTGTASVGSVSVSGTGSTRTVQLGSVSGNGTLGISIAQGTAADTSGNLAVAAGASATFVVDGTDPTVSMSAPSQGVTTNGPVSYTVTFADANLVSASLITSQVTMNSSGTAAAGSVNVTGSGTVWTVRLGSLSGNGTMGISLPAGLASDGAGNTSAAAGPSTTFFVGNTAPDVDLNGATAGNGVAITFTEQTPALIAPSATLTDAEGSPVLALEVTLIARPDGDAIEALSLNASATSAAGGLTVTPYDAPTGVLLISGSAPTATYETILRGILYNNSSDNPNTSVRSVTVVASDDTPSTTRTSAITVIAVNDNPAAGSDTLIRHPGRPAKISKTELLSNDSDPENEAIVISLPNATSANGASVSIEGEWVIYSSPPNDNNDSFTYTATDPHGQGATGTVNVQVQLDLSQSGNTLGITNDGNDIVLSFSGIPGIDYLIQYATTLVSPTWTLLNTVTAALDGSIEYRDLNPPPPTRYYRTFVP